MLRGSGRVCSPSGGLCRHRRSPDKWSCVCSHSAPGRAGLQSRVPGGPAGKHKQEEEGEEVETHTHTVNTHTHTHTVNTHTHTHTHTHTQTHTHGGRSDGMLS